MADVIEVLAFTVGIIAAVLAGAMLLWFGSFLVGHGFAHGRLAAMRGARDEVKA